MCHFCLNQGVIFSVLLLKNRLPKTVVSGFVYFPPPFFSCGYCCTCFWEL
ncbi:hypothetical protein Gotur_032782, partial [Gossypium turneri]